MREVIAGIQERFGMRRMGEEWGDVLKQRRGAGKDGENVHCGFLSSR